MVGQFGCSFCPTPPLSSSAQLTPSVPHRITAFCTRVCFHVFIPRLVPCSSFSSSRLPQSSFSLFCKQSQTKQVFLNSLPIRDHTSGRRCRHKRIDSNSLLPCSSGGNLLAATTPSFFLIVVNVVLRLPYVYVFVHTIFACHRLAGTGPAMYACVQAVQPETKHRE
ncbi:hypothetical protein CRM22_005014 [Opisthorchis felineus]|uniref:Uncharacterized protein n=1 Tax=Opisthorchis felineus TaxID=147828 RepID=A0A4V6RH09_OPIFE|nr:hypothetical protein CRM22_005014 [Opisthorchis felineus]